MTEIIEADSGALLLEARRFFEEYAKSLGINLDFQGFDEELAQLPGNYDKCRKAVGITGIGRLSVTK